jgi:isochorismate synthase
MYDLYLYLLLTLPEVKTAANNKIEERKRKMRPTADDLNPNLKFVENALIQQLEGHERSLYAGVIGLVNEHSSNLFVNLRCAQVFNDAVTLYLGGGHTEDSDANAEWEETENKARTLLNILQNH